MRIVRLELTVNNRPVDIRRKPIKVHLHLLANTAGRTVSPDEILRSDSLFSAARDIPQRSLNRVRRITVQHVKLLNEGLPLYDDLMAQ